MKGKNIVVYDLEIKTPIEKLTRGWNSKDEMGVSVGCAYDYLNNRYRVFMDDNLYELVDRLNAPDTLVVAFNHIGFDNDLLRQTKIERPDKKGFSLDDHLRTLGLSLKTANGSLAPIWWQAGKVGRVVDYCLNDVDVERRLFEYIIENRQLACAAFPTPYQVALPMGVL